MGGGGPLVAEVRVAGAVIAQDTGDVFVAEEAVAYSRPAVSDKPAKKSLVRWLVKIVSACRP